eukprot:TRINITY_DN20892_c0_g1_i1.p1 TRINITY_DN20892_c0_g1~~TRINITY_DN20892_c0_g1_i1.p1  ORF type:complete len:194 (+),score=32.53 TRINITY_DN20892_c0_g1_i1:44-625(+)
MSGSEYIGSERDCKEDMRVKRFMSHALEQAQIAFDMREVPVGCVIVLGNEVIGRGGNRTNCKKNATRHAEFEAIDEILSTRAMDRKDWQNSELYVTCEPCVMCASAIAHLNIGKVYFGCSNDRFGGCGSVYEIHNSGSVLPDGSSFECIKGIDSEDAVELFRRFYARTNVNAPNPRKRAKIGDGEEATKSEAD